MLHLQEGRSSWQKHVAHLHMGVATYLAKCVVGFGMHFASVILLQIHMAVPSVIE